MNKAIVLAVAVAAVTTFMMSSTTGAAPSSSVGPGSSFGKISFVKQMKCSNIAKKVVSGKRGAYNYVKFNRQTGRWTCYYGYHGHKWATTV